MEDQVNIQKNVNKVKKPKKKKFWIVMLIVGLICLVSVPVIIIIIAISLVMLEYYMPCDGSDNKFSQDIDVSAFHGEANKYYDTIEDAIDAANIEVTNNIEKNYTVLSDVIDPDAWEKGTYTFKEELLRLEDDDAVTVIVVDSVDLSEAIVIYTFDKKEDKYSNYTNIEVTGVRNMITSKLFLGNAEFGFDEQIALDFMSSIWTNQTSYANDGVLVPYGLTDNEDIYNLTIMGEKPTDIIPIDYDGKTYYFWYFNSEMIDEQIREEVVSPYTCGDVIDWVNIEVND